MIISRHIFTRKVEEEVRLDHFCTNTAQKEIHFHPKATQSSVNSSSLLNLYVYSVSQKRHSPGHR